MSDSTRNQPGVDDADPENDGPIRVVKIHDLRSGDVDPGGGRIILVDRLWPRGVAKDSIHIDDWFKEVAPSPDLRRWFNHEPEMFDDFGHRYRHELDERAQSIDRSDSESGGGSDDGDGDGDGDAGDPAAGELAELAAAASQATVAKPLYLAYAAKNRDHNHALILAAWLREGID